MPVLTWRNVDAPDFRGAAQGKNAAAQLLGNAFNGLSQGLGDFQKSTQSEADAAALKNLIGIKDPNQYDQQLAAANLTNVSSDGLKALAGRSSQLLAQAASRQEMGTKAYAQGRTMLDDGRKDAAIPGMAAYLDASANGDEETMARLRTENPGLRGLDIDSQQKMAASGLAGTNGYRSARNSDATYFNNQQDRTENRAGDTLAQVVRSQTRPDDTVGQMAALENSGASPQVVAQALKSLGQTGVAPYTAPRPVASSAGGGKASAAIGSAAGLGGASFAANIPFDETRNYVANITSKAGDVTGTNEEKAAKLLPFLIGQESGGDNGAVSPKGARGLTQVMPATGTDPGYGVKPLQNQSAEEYKRFGNDYLKAMLDKYDGDVPKALAAYNGGPGTVDSWLAGNGGKKGEQDTTSEFAVGNKQMSGSGQDTVSPGEVSAVQTDLAGRQMYNSTNGSGAQTYLKNAVDQRPVATIAQELVTTDFKGGDAGKIAAELNDLVTRSKGQMNYAQAADVLRSSAGRAAWWRAGTTSAGGDSELGFIDSKLNQAVIDSQTGSVAKQAIAQQGTIQDSAAVTAAQKAAQDAQAQLTQLQNDISAGRNGLVPQLPAVQKKVNAANDRLRLLMTKALGDPNNQLPRQTKAPEQKNREMNIPDPKSLAQTVDNKLLPPDFGLYD